MLTPETRSPSCVKFVGSTSLLVGLDDWLVYIRIHDRAPLYRPRSQIYGNDRTTIPIDNKYDAYAATYAGGAYSQPATVFVLFMPH